METFMTLAATMTNRLLPALQQGFHDIQTGCWEWTELANSLSMVELFQGKLHPNNLNTRSSSFFLVLTESVKFKIILSAGQNLIKQMIEKPTFKDLYLAYFPPLVYLGTTWVYFFKPHFPAHQKIRKKIRRIYEVAVPPVLDFLVNPRLGIFDFFWTVILIAKPNKWDNPRVHYLFEHTIVLPLMLAKINASKRGDLKLLLIVQLIRRFFPQNPWLQDGIKPYITNLQIPSITNIAITLNLIQS
jgi:hypothetical protein